MIELLGFVHYLIDLYTYVVLFAVILNLLTNFGVINPYNPMVRSIGEALAALTEPLLRPIRASLPDMGGLDISPVVLLIGCYFVQSVVIPNLVKLVS